MAEQSWWNLVGALGLTCAASVLAVGLVAIVAHRVAERRDRSGAAELTAAPVTVEQPPLAAPQPVITSRVRPDLNIEDLVRLYPWVDWAHGVSGDPAIQRLLAQMGGQP